MIKNRIDVKDQRFGKLTVISSVGKDYRQHMIWNCICDCGNTTNVSIYRLLDGRTKSCGCLRNKPYEKHGLSNINPRLYKIWRSMRERCNNPNKKCYQWYGAKGVTICENWNSYPPFYYWSLENGYANNLTIDRIDSNGNYEPNNCQWITKGENSSKAHKGIKRVCARGKHVN